MDSQRQRSIQWPPSLFNEDEGEIIETGNHPLSARTMFDSLSPPSLHSMIPESESSTTSSSSMLFSSDEEYQDLQRSGHPSRTPAQNTINTNVNFINACEADKLKSVSGPRAVISEDSRMHVASLDTNEVLLQSPELQPWDVNRLVLRILSYCRVRELCAMMSVNRHFYVLATDDVVWKEFLSGLNLQPLFSFPTGPQRNFYRYFVDEIITTRALHGHYFFEAANPPTLLDDGSSSINEGGSGKPLKAGSPKSTLQQRLSVQQQPDELMFPVEAITLLLSSASLGQMNHTIGRVQLYVEYKDKATEMIQGAARFCLHRGCFMFSCASFGSSTRGPAFTVAIKTVRKRWVNQSYQQFTKHLDGIQLIMTPALLEGQCLGSRITERDIISVSRPLVRNKQ